MQERQRLSRERFRRVLAERGDGADGGCGSAHHWGRASPGAVLRNKTIALAAPTPTVALRGRAQCVITMHIRKEPFHPHLMLLHEESDKIVKLMLF